MDRVLKAARRAGIFFERLSSVSSAFQKSLVELFPFANATPPSSAPNYSKRRGDFLFLPAHTCAKELLRFESFSFFIVLLGASVVVVWGMAALFGVSTGVIIVSIVALLNAALVIFKLWVVYKGGDTILKRASAQQLATLTSDDLPMYTVLVPLREEAAVMPQIVASLSRIDYPIEKLDLIITLEQYDHETREAIRLSGAPAHWRVVTLPDTQPKTKPKALNVAFLEAKGEYLVIYDAEIIPDRDQLLQAAYAFKRSPEIACLQTRLDHYNTDQSILTKLFTTEFTFYYDLFLPGLQALGLPIPLSGHSTHFRMDALRAIGAWDPYNVAEDCDVGMRLYRAGFRSGMMNSFSQEEATATVGAWIRQRTRWMKGFIQTSIVHLRHPVLLAREFGGWRYVAAFAMLVPGMVIYSVLNVLTLLIFVSWIITGADAIKSLYPLPVLYLSTASFMTGVFAFTFLNLVAVCKRDKARLVRYWVFMPLYWLLLSYAAVRAAGQLMWAPHLWEKTAHGTHLSPLPHSNR